MCSNCQKSVELGMTIMFVRMVSQVEVSSFGVKRFVAFPITPVGMTGADDLNPAI